MAELVGIRIGRRKTEQAGDHGGKKFIGIYKEKVGGETSGEC